MYYSNYLSTFDMAINNVLHELFSIFFFYYYLSLLLHFFICCCFRYMGRIWKGVEDGSKRQRESGDRGRIWKVVENGSKRQREWRQGKDW